MTALPARAKNAAVGANTLPLSQQLPLSFTFVTIAETVDHDGMAKQSLFLAFMRNAHPLPLTISADELLISDTARNTQASKNFSAISDVTIGVQPRFPGSIFQTVVNQPYFLGALIQDRSGSDWLLAFNDPKTLIRLLEGLTAHQIHVADPFDLRHHLQDRPPIFKAFYTREFAALAAKAGW